MEAYDFNLLRYMLSRNYITLFLIVLLGFKLHARKSYRDADLRFYWITLICTLLLVIEDTLESYTAYFPEMVFWRTLLSVAGYILRPTAAVSLLLVVCPPEHRTWKLWIPWIINTAVFLCAFFTPAVFGFDEEYDFFRGPLGYVVFVVSFLYMFMILFTVLRYIYESKSAERRILVVCVIGCIGAAISGAIYGGILLNEAVLICATFLLIYLRSHDNNYDTLTALRNRFAFYDDTEPLSRDVTAVASVDMNGLKRMNDTQGHAEGDRALAEIGRCLSEIGSRSIVPYRVGGDEFTILFSGQSEEDVVRTLRTLKDNVVASGYSVSTGYVMRTDDETLDDLLRDADQNMYQDKAEYYQQYGRDRRSRRQ